MSPSKLKMISNATHDGLRPQNEFYTGAAQGFLGCFKNSDRYQLALQTELPKSIIKPGRNDSRNRRLSVLFTRETRRVIDASIHSL